MEENTNYSRSETIKHLVTRYEDLQGNEIEYTSPLESIDWPDRERYKDIYDYSLPFVHMKDNVFRQGQQYYAYGFSVYAPTSKDQKVLYKIDTGDIKWFLNINKEYRTDI